MSSPSSNPEATTWGPIDDVDSDNESHDTPFILPTAADYNDPISLNLISAILALYGKSTPENKTFAKSTKKWLDARFKCFGEFAQYFETTDVKGEEFIVGRTDKVSSFHFTWSKVYHIGDRATSGLELLLAIAAELNPKIKAPIEKAVAANVPVPPSFLDEVSLGDARVSRRIGVYGLVIGLVSNYDVANADKKLFIIGQTTVAFSSRLGRPLYSTSTKVVASMGAIDTDQRRGRRDFILFDITDVEEFKESLMGWLAGGLETLAIAITNSTKVGLNTNAFDRRSMFRCLTALQAQELWEALRAAAAQEQVPGQGPRFTLWYQQRVRPVLSFSLQADAGLLWYRTLAALTANEYYVHFPPMPPNHMALFVPPLLQGHGGRHLARPDPLPARDVIYVNRPIPPTVALLHPSLDLSQALQAIAAERDEETIPYFRPIRRRARDNRTRMRLYGLDTEQTESEEEDDEDMEELMDEEAGLSGP